MNISYPVDCGKFDDNFSKVVENFGFVELSKSC